MRTAVTALVLLAACGPRHKERDRDACGPPVTASGERPARQVVQAQAPGATAAAEAAAGMLNLAFSDAAGGDMAFSADGKLVISDRNAHIWDLASGRLLANIADPIRDAYGMAWDGDEVAIWSDVRAIRVSQDGAVRTSEPLESRETDDGGVEHQVKIALATASGAKAIDAWLYEPADQASIELRLVEPLAGSQVLVVDDVGIPDTHTKLDQANWALSADGQHVILMWNEFVEGYYWTSMVAVWTLGEATATAEVVWLPEYCQGLVPSPDASTLYATSLDTLYVVDPERQQIHRADHVLELANDLAITPGGDRLFIASKAGLLALELPSLDVAWREMLPGAHAAWSVGISPDGQALVAISDEGSLSVHDPATGRERGQLGWLIDSHMNKGRPLVEQDLRLLDDQTLAVVGRDHLTLWSLDDAKPTVQLAVNDLSAVRLEGDDLVTMRAALCDRDVVYEVASWDHLQPPSWLATDGQLAICSDPAGRGKGVAVRMPIGFHTHLGMADVDWDRGVFRLQSESASWILDAASVTTARLFETDAGPIATLRGGVLGEWDFGAWDHDYQALRVFDPGTGEQIAEIHPPRRIEWLEGSDRGRHGAWFGVDGDRHRVALAGATWLAEMTMDDEVLWQVDLAHEPTLGSELVFAPDGAILVGGRDGALTIARDGAVTVGTSDGGAIREIAVSPSGAIAATRSEDGALRVWDLATGKVRGTLVEFDDDEYLAYLSDGSFTGTHEAAARVAWVFDEPTEAFAFEQFAQFERPDAVRAALRGESWTPMPSSLLRPPSATLDAPASGDGTVSVVVSAASATRVDRVRIYADARPVAEAPMCSASGTTRLEVPLLPGVNRVTAVAYDDRGQSSNEVSADVTAAKSNTVPDLWIVAVGVSSYPNLDEADQLAFADDDARALAEGVAAHAAGRYREVHSTILTDEQVTRKALLAALRGLDQMAPDDLAIVLLAGHGARPSDSEDMRFLTTEATFDVDDIRERGIGWSDIAYALAQARGRVLVLLDACHAGHVSQDIVVPNDALAAKLAGASRAGVVVFAASKGRQLSYEPSGVRAIGRRDKTAAIADDPGNGLFTAAVLATLDDPDADRDGDGAIELTELVLTVQAIVDSKTDHKQTPWLARKEAVGDFAIVDAAR